MFQSAEHYMKKSLNERRSHLDLSTPCVFVGANSGENRALLALTLKTLIPRKRLGMVCHACDNPKCSNVKHLYWGNDRDNHYDLRSTGKWLTIEEKGIRKYGKEQWNEMRKSIIQRANITRAKNAKKKTSMHYETFREIFDNIPKTRGWVTSLSKRLNLSHTQIRRIHLRLQK